MPNNDLIDRRPLIEHFERLALSLENARYFIAADVIQRAAEKLRSAPAVDAEPVRHGRWLEDGSIGAIGNYCSLCDKRVKPDANYNYCPNCGAKMEKST